MRLAYGGVMSTYTSLYPIGKMVGEWTVIGEPVMDDRSRAKIPVRCSCGNETAVYGYHLKKGKSTQCKTCSSGKSPTYLGITNKAYRSSVIGGIQEFNITANSLSESFVEQSGTCVISGEPITTGDSVAVRYDSNEGYTIENTALVSQTAKEMMGSLCINDFVQRCYNVVQNVTKQSPIEAFFNKRGNENES